MHNVRLVSLLETNPVVREIFNTKLVHTLKGEPVPLDSNLDDQAAEALFRHVCVQKPRIAVEVGMANGISTLAILTALENNGGEGRLISIDPNQSTQWRNCGRASVQRAGLVHRHTVMEEADWKALPRLLEQFTTVDFGYIDGWHTFDYVLLDFLYLDKLMPVDGVVAFNDCGWPAVEKVIRFVETHRHYHELDVGLPKTYARPSGLRDILRALKYGRLGAYFLRREDRYFRKTEVWEPGWGFYSKF